MISVIRAIEISVPENWRSRSWGEGEGEGEGSTCFLSRGGGGALKWGGVEIFKGG